MTPTFLLEAFGQFSPGAALAGHRSSGDRDGTFHGVFNGRAELMNWSNDWSRRGSPLLWNLYEAGLSDTADASVVGWVYGELSSLAGIDRAVQHPRDLPEITRQELSRLLETMPEGTRMGWASSPDPGGYSETVVEAAMSLPALLQCLEDALRRIGTVQFSGFQVSWQTPRTPRDKRSFHNTRGSQWFSAESRDRIDALITFDNGFLGDHAETELATGLQRRHTEPFQFGQVVDVPCGQSIKVPKGGPFHSIDLSRSGLGLAVNMPEWTASSAGWALANVMDAAGDLAPGIENFAIRISRVQ